MSPADSLASSNLPADLLRSVEEDTSSHLLDHNYALSPYDEYFAGESGASSLSQKPNIAGNRGAHDSISVEFEGGASSQTSQPLSAAQRLSRDEKRAKKIGLPFMVVDIIDLPIDA